MIVHDCQNWYQDFGIKSNQLFNKTVYKMVPSVYSSRFRIKVRQYETSNV